MSVPVHPICSGCRPDRNGGVAQGLRDTMACLLQPQEHIIAPAHSRKKRGGGGVVMEGDMKSRHGKTRMRSAHWDL